MLCTVGAAKSLSGQPAERSMGSRVTVGNVVALLPQGEGIASL